MSQDLTASRVDVPPPPAPTGPSADPSTSGASGRQARARLRTVGAVIGLTWIVLVVLLSLTVSIWSKYGVNQQNTNLTLMGPSSAHLLGTDDLGRDVLTRLFAAGASTIGDALLTVVVAFAIGVPLALIAAERERLVEKAISRLAEVFLSLPIIVVLLAVVGILGTDMVRIMIVLGVLISAGVYRLLLNSARAVRTQLYVDAAEADGLGSWRTNFRHVLPALTPIIAVQTALLFAGALLIESGLAFMGFGPPPPAASWGALIGTASANIYNDPWLMVPSGLMLALTVLAANAIGDALGRDRTAPIVKRRRRRLAAVTTSTSAESATPAAVAQGSSDPALDVHVTSGSVAGALDAVLRVERLVVTADDGPDIVSGVSFSLRPGSVLGLVGESGCGKTMTALAILGLCPPGVSVNGGSVKLGGRDTTYLSDRERAAVLGRTISYVAQEPSVALDPMFSAGYQLMTPIKRLRGVSRSEARTIARDLLRRVGIVDPDTVMRRYPHQLSGGMAQRLAIALALSGNPKVLVADEPTTALDVTVQADLLDLFRSLVADEGLSVIIVTHDLGVVADLCDDVAVMYAGQIVERGTVAKVLGDPQHPYTSALLGADPHAHLGEGRPDRLPTIPGQVPPPWAWPSGCRFAERCAYATPACGQPVAGIAVGEVMVRCLTPGVAGRAAAAARSDAVAAAEPHAVSSEGRP